MFDSKYISDTIPSSLYTRFVNIIVFLVIITIIGYLFFNLNLKIDYLLNGVSNTLPHNIKFNEFFFDINFLFTFFSLLLPIYIFSVSKNTQRLIISLFVTLFVLHYISSPGIQIVRGMLYFLPLFYLSTIISVDAIAKLFKNNKIIYILFIIIIFGAFGSNLYDNYKITFKGYQPTIPGEIGYHDYKGAYEFIKYNLEDYIIIQPSFSVRTQTMYDVVTDYKLNLQSIHKYYSDKEDVGDNNLFLNTPTITDKKEFYDIVKNNLKVCVVLRGNSKMYFLDDESYDFIINSFENKKEFFGFTIYYTD